jgi:hypothetical protein
MLVGIAGKKGAGKDTLAHDLVEHRHWINNYLAAGKVFHFADTLKKVTVELLGIPAEMVYGTQEDKEQKCHIRWENMPTYELMGDVRPTGRMSVREVLQYFGTEILRKMYARVHINATFNAIAQYEQSQDGQVLSVVADLRFPNECDAIKEEGGIVIGLTRGEKGDNHASENALDDYSFNVLIDNIGMTREEQLEAALKSLRRSYR